MFTHSRSWRDKDKRNTVVWRDDWQGQVHAWPLHCGRKKSKINTLIFTEIFRERSGETTESDIRNISAECI